MADFPALPLFTDAFIADTGHLDATETGAYLSLLMAAWRAPGCCLPDDDVRLARMARCDTRTWNRVKATVMAFWTLGEDGCWRQKRLSKTLEFCNTSRHKKREAAVATNRKLAERRAAGKPQLKLLKNQDLIDAERNAERIGERDAERTAERDASRTQSDTHSKSKSISNISSPPNGGADSAAPRDGFAAWEAQLLAVEGVKGSGLAISSMHPIAELQRDGFSLTAEIIPILKADLASATAKGRLPRMSWGTIARKVREARQSPASGPQGAPATTPPVDWAKRIGLARMTRQWPNQWGPWPHTPGCPVPPELLEPTDGDGWTAWEDTA